MGKNELIACIADQYGYPKATIKAVLDGFTEMIVDALSDGETVQLQGFGTFSTTEIAERQGRNPSNGESVTIAAHRRIKFKPANGFKEAVK
jgi:DNA-binding protein HU-beta